MNLDLSSRSLLYWASHSIARVLGSAPAILVHPSGSGFLGSRYWKVSA